MCGRFYFRKAEKDIAVILLQRAEPKLELKWVRKFIILDLIEYLMKLGR